MSSLAELNFSSALSALAEFVHENFEVDAINGGIFVRDGFGRLSFYYRGKLASRILKALNKNALDILKGYAAPFGCIFDESGPGANSVFSSRASAMRVCLKENLTVCLVDRRFFGRDWISKPKALQEGLPPIMVFNSMKGGVGRSTALFVLAIHLSRLGRNVLLFDMDLEAPGLSTLVFRGPQPQFGVIDYLVESGLRKISKDDLSLFVGTSDLTDNEFGQGRIDIVPATGLETAREPAVMMAKLARAVVERPVANGEPITLSNQIAELVERIASQSEYDAILIDSRAGLSEVTAGPLLGLGAHNLIFGTDQPHTFEAFRFLLAHLSLLPVDTATEDWRRRIHFVHAKSKVSADSREEFDDKLYDVLAETFYESDENEDVFNFNYDDGDAPHSALRIFFNTEYMDVDPVRDSSLIEEDVYKAAFGSFLSRSTDILGLGENNDDLAADTL